MAEHGKTDSVPLKKGSEVTVRATTSAPGSGSPHPQLHQDWAHPTHIRAGAGLTPPTSRRCGSARAVGIACYRSARRGSHVWCFIRSLCIGHGSRGTASLRRASRHSRGAVAASRSSWTCRRSSRWSAAPARRCDGSPTVRCCRRAHRAAALERARDAATARPFVRARAFRRPGVLGVLTGQSRRPAPLRRLLAAQEGRPCLCAAVASPAAVQRDAHGPASALA